MRQGHWESVGTLCEEKEPGVIVVDRKKEEVEITKVAEKDWVRKISAEELNEWLQRLMRLQENLAERIL